MSINKNKPTFFLSVGALPYLRCENMAMLDYSILNVYNHTNICCKLSFMKYKSDSKSDYIFQINYLSSKYVKKSSIVLIIFIDNGPIFYYLIK